MMPALQDALLVVSHSLAASIVVKATAAAALGLVVARGARNSRASVRHAILAATFGVLLALPIAAVFAPPVRIVLPAVSQARVAATVPTGVRIRPADSVGSARAAGPALSDFLLAGWLAGLAVCMLPVIAGLWQVRSLRRSALPWPEGQCAAGALAYEAGLRARVEVLLHDQLPGPMTCGVVHPAIVLPRDAQAWDSADLTRAMVHELEHVRRADWASQCAARVLCAVYWFHPLVWMAWREFTLDAERACDDAVVGRSEATAYAEQLVGLAQRLSSAAKLPLPAMANRADLSRRVAAVLDGRQRRGRAGRLSVALACAAAAVLVLTMSPLTIIAAPQDAGNQVRQGYSAASKLVMQTVIVADRSGQSIEGLQATDFVVTEDGVSQQIAVFEFQKVLPTVPGVEAPASYYVIGYYPANTNPDGKFRTIRITLKSNPDAKLNYRVGYTIRLTDGGVQLVSTPDPSRPTLLVKVEPEYSDEARRAKYQGTVVLLLDVDESGHVTSARVTRSLGLGLDEKAIEAVKKWKFRPALKDGRPVAAQTSVDVSFRLL